MKKKKVKTQKQITTPEQAIAEMKAKYPNDVKIIDPQVIDARQAEREFHQELEPKLNAQEAQQVLKAIKEDEAQVKELAKAKTEKAKAEPKPKKEKGPSLAGLMDAVLAEGGTWESIIEKVTAEAAKLGLTSKVTAGVLRSHFKTRPGRETKFANLTATEEGITITAK